MKKLKIFVKVIKKKFLRWKYRRLRKLIRLLERRKSYTYNELVEVTEEIGLLDGSTIEIEDVSDKRELELKLEELSKIKDEICKKAQSCQDCLFNVRADLNCNLYKINQLIEDCEKKLWS